MHSHGWIANGHGFMRPVTGCYSVQCYRTVDDEHCLEER